ncbi:DUF6500 family protein, partial [Acinetobacter baumannii]
DNPELLMEAAHWWIMEQMIVIKKF